MKKTSINFKLKSNQLLSALFFLVTLLSFSKSQGQLTINDYRSKQNGNWSDASTWQTKNNASTTASWQDATVAPASLNNVFIQSGHTVTLTQDASCADLNSNTAGVLSINTFILNINGKIRAFTGFAEVSTDDGITLGTSATALTSTMITTSTGSTPYGVMKFVGVTRNITNTGEWAASGLTTNVEFTLTSGNTGTFVTGFKAKNITIVTGIMSTSGQISVGTGTSDSLIIKSGARLISSRSATTSAIINNTSTAKCNKVIIESGGVLELTGTTPAIDCSNFVNNGTIVYSKAGTQTLLQPGADATSTTALYTYSTLILSGSSAKTPFASITVSTLLQFNGTATIASTASLTLTMLNGSTVDRAVTSGTSLPSTAGAVFYGTASTDLVNVTISSTLNNSNEMPSAPTPGKVGTLTIASGVTYTFTGGRSVTNLVNNGFVAFSPSTTLTFTIEGNISGTGTITGNVNASLQFIGANTGDAGTINFTSGSQVANNLIINRTGTNASVTLGTPVTLSTVNGSGTLNLTAGTLIGNSNTITVTGNLTGTSGIYTATGNGKIVMSGNSIASTIASVTLANLELNDADGFTISSPNITGTLTLTLGIATITGTLTLKSSTNGTASIAQITGGTISGNVTVERFIPSLSRKKYTLVSSPVTSTINAGWQEGTGTSSTFKTVSGYGTSITNAVVTQGANGFDGPTNSTSSIFTYDDTKASGSKWTSLANTTDAASLTPGKGYLLFVRGDRSENRASTGNSSNTILRASGTVGQGTISPTLLSGANQYTLIANPYPCAIDWLSINITKTNLTGSFTVYDANLGTFVSSTGNIKTPSVGTQQTQYLQSGQAFFVQNTATGSGGITFTEAAKITSTTTTSATTVFGEGIVAQQLNINVYRVDNNQFADGAVALFGKQFKADIDNNDITKFTNFNETLGLRRGNTVLGLEARPKVATNDTLFFSLNNFGKRDYNLVIDGSNFTDVTAVLEDKYNASKQAIDLSGTHTYKFTVNGDVASSSNDRFIITFTSTAKQTVADATTNYGLFVKLSPNPVANQLQISFRTSIANQTTINIVNSLGQVVKTVNAGNVNNGNITIPVTNLLTGIYTVQLLSGDKQISSQKLVKE